MPVSLMLIFLPMAAALTQTQTDDFCNNGAPGKCTAAEDEACCGKSPKEYPIFTIGGTACECAASPRILQAKIDTDCAAKLAIPVQPNCTTKQTECCQLSPKRWTASSTVLGCCCAAADSTEISECSGGAVASGSVRLGGGGAAVGFGALGLAFLLA